MYVCSVLSPLFLFFHLCYFINFVSVVLSTGSVCVCVCVCVYERERVCVCVSFASQRTPGDVWKHFWLFHSLGRGVISI